MAGARALSGLSVLALLFSPHSMFAQSEPDAFQLASVTLGWGVVRPVGSTGLDGAVADGGGSLHLGATLEMRQNDWVLAYGRLDADVAEVRQHLGAAGGMRIMPPTSRSVRPFIGAGLGLLMLEPRANVATEFTREFTLRGEGFLGAEWSWVPGLYGFAEYRLTAARYLAVARQPGCTQTIDRCLLHSQRAATHLGHSGWIGLRIRLI
jgi:hypothetical protein